MFRVTFAVLDSFMLYCFFNVQDHSRVRLSLYQVLIRICTYCILSCQVKMPIKSIDSAVNKPQVEAMSAIP